MTERTLATGILTRITHSVIFYPISIVYLSAALVVALAAGHWIRFDVGFALLTLVVIATLLVSTRRELTLVYSRANAQHGAQMARIEQLIDALIAAGVAVPQNKTED